MAARRHLQRKSVSRCPRCRRRPLDTDALLDDVRRALDEILRPGGWRTVMVLCDGVEIGYDDVGTGVPVAFVHGFPHNRTLWAPQVGALVDRARCIAPDLRGFGESSKHGPFSIDQFADDLALLLRLLGIERAVVAGLSMGGYVALADR